MPLPPEFELITTGDGSPTLAYAPTGGRAERMHHSAGARAESVFVYGTALDLALTNPASPEILSVGLGLGYNELLSIAKLNQRGRAGRITSFESLAFLRDGFSDWANGSRGGELTATYDVIASTSGVDAKIVAQWLANDRLRLRGIYPDPRVNRCAYNLVYFDAYSNQTNPELWAEETLVRTLQGLLAPTCVFATYAATSGLNRALARLGFRRLKRRGFDRKRECTLAVRGSAFDASPD